jgi:hypothetical protein
MSGFFVSLEANPYLVLFHLVGMADWIGCHPLHGVRRLAMTCAE